MALPKRVCFYCDAIYVVSASAPGDHFPISKRNGGTAVVDCCRECHSLKDRMSVAEWHPGMIGKVCADFPRLSRETGIFLAKCIDALSDLSQSPQTKG